MQTFGVIGFMKNEKKLDLKILCALFIEKEVYFLLNGAYLWISTNLIYHWHIFEAGYQEEISQNDHL